MQARQKPLLRQQPYLQSVQAQAALSVRQLLGIYTQLLDEALRKQFAAQAVQTKRAVQAVQVLWQAWQRLPEPLQQPAAQVVQATAEAETRQLARALAVQAAPLIWQPCSQTVQLPAVQVAQFAVAHATQAAPDRQNPLKQAVQVQTLAITEAVARSQPAKAHAVQAPAVRVYPGQHCEQFPQISEIFRQLFPFWMQVMPTRQQRRVRVGLKSFWHCVGVFWSLQRKAPGMKLPQDWQRPELLRKQVSAHCSQAMKLLLLLQVVQPAEPPQVVSVQRMQRLETRMPAEQVVQVEPSEQVRQWAGQLRQLLWKRQQLARQPEQVPAALHEPQPAGQAAQSPPLATPQQQPLEQVRQLVESVQEAQLAWQAQQRLLASQKPGKHSVQNPLPSISKQPGLTMQRPEQRKVKELATGVQSVQAICVPSVCEQQLEQAPQMPELCGHWMHCPPQGVQPATHELQVLMLEQTQFGRQASQCCRSKNYPGLQTQQALAGAAGTRRASSSRQDVRQDRIYNNQSPRQMIKYNTTLACKQPHKYHELTRSMIDRSRLKRANLCPSSDCRRSTSNHGLSFLHRDMRRSLYFSLTARSFSSSAYLKSFSRRQGYPGQKWGSLTEASAILGQQCATFCRQSKIILTFCTSTSPIVSRRSMRKSVTCSKTGCVSPSCWYFMSSRHFSLRSAREKTTQRVLMLCAATALSRMNLLLMARWQCRTVPSSPAGSGTLWTQKAWSILEASAQRGRNCSSLMRITEGSVSGLTRCWSQTGTFFIGLNRLKFSKARTRTSGSLLRFCLRGTCSKRQATQRKRKERISMERLSVRDSPITSCASWNTSASASPLSCESKLWITMISFQSASITAGGLMQAFCMQSSSTEKYSGSSPATRSKCRFREAYSSGEASQRWA